MIKVISKAFQLPHTPPEGTEGRCECGAKLRVVGCEDNGFKPHKRISGKGRKHVFTTFGWVNECPECGETAFFAFALSINGGQFQRL